MAVAPAEWASWWQRARSWWAVDPALRRRQAGAALVGLAAAGAAGAWALSPHWAPLYTGLAPATAGAMTGVLQQAKIPYQLAPGGSTILVPAAAVAQARITLAEHNLPASGQTVQLPPPSALSLGETPQQVAAAQQAALEQTLAATLTHLQGVTGAQVVVTPAPPALFGEGAAPATASVFLQLAPGVTLTPSQVAAVQHLVAGTVSGLTPDHVTVVDQAGTLLSGRPAVPSGPSQVQAAWRAQAAVDQLLEQRAASLLDQIYGPGAAVVRVNAVLAFTTRRQRQVAYGQPVPQATQQTTQTQAAGGGQPAGTAANVPTYTVPAPTNGTSGQQTTITRYAVPTTTTTTTTPPGAVQRLTVAVAVDRPLSPAQQAAVQRLVEQAVGFDAARGDAITVAGIPFNTAAAQAAQRAIAAAARRQQQEELAAAGAGAVLLGVLGLLLRRRRPVPSALPPPPVVPEAASAAGPPQPGLPAPPPTPAYVEALQDWAERDPEALARVLRTLIEEDDRRTARH